MWTLIPATLKCRLPEARAYSSRASAMGTPNSLGLPDAGEDHLARGTPVNLEHTFQFAARNHVEPAPHSCDEAKNAKAGIGFDGVADRVPDFSERVVESSHPTDDA